MKDRIEIGDMVNIYFNTADALFNVKIIDKPLATGDCWKAVGNRTGIFYNIQTYNYMEIA